MHYRPVVQRKFDIKMFTNLREVDITPRGHDAELRSSSTLTPAFESTSFLQAVTVIRNGTRNNKIELIREVVEMTAYITRVCFA